MEVELLLAKQDWRAITMRLTLFAYGRLGHRSIETAKDVAQEALARIWDPEYKDWDPAKEPDLLGHLRSVVNGIVSDIRQLSRTKSERSEAPDKLARRATKDSIADGRDADGKIDAESFLYRLLALVADDATVTDLIYLMSDGVDKPAEQALHLKCDRKDIYNANRRLGGHVENLRATIATENSNGS